MFPMIGAMGGSGLMQGLFGIMQMMMMMQLLQLLMGGHNGHGGCHCHQHGYNNGLQDFFNHGTTSPVYPQPTQPIPYNAVTGNQIADVALAYQGRHFKPGQRCRCADWVSTVIQQSGNAPPGFQHQMSAAGLARYGSEVAPNDLKPGDVVFFGNTYRQGRYTHVGIYLGDGKFAHRSSAGKPVKIDNLNSPYYREHFSGARRLPSASAPQTLHT